MINPPLFLEWDNRFVIRECVVPCEMVQSNRLGENKAMKLLTSLNIMTYIYGDS